MPFAIPPQTALAQWADITPAPTAWTRPADWPVITDNANELNFLVADTGLAAFALATTFTRSGATGNVYVEWGDGTTTTISTNTATTTYKNYTVGSGTACSLGYTTFKCRIYADPTVTGITRAQFIGPARTSDSRSVYQNYSSGVLEIYLGNTLTTFTTYNSYVMGWTTTQGTALGNTQQLTYFKFPATVTASDFTSCFANNYSLRQVVMPTSASSMSLCATMFYQCPVLSSVTFPTNATGITTLDLCFQTSPGLTTVVLPPTLNSCTTMNGTFQNCYFLTSVRMPTSMNTCTTMNQTFQSCFSLTRLTMPTSMNACINYTSTFDTCKNLQAIVISTWNTNINQTLNLTTMFRNCYVLANVQLPATCAAGTVSALTNMFSACNCLLSVNLSAFSGSDATAWNAAINSPVYQCYNLVSVVLPTTMNTPTSMTGSFNTNVSLQTITMPTSMTSLTSMSATFQSCLSLKSITLPTTVGASIALTSAFSQCYSLTSITIPSGWNLTNLTTTFQTCYSLQTVTLPPGAQNSLTQMTQTFQSCTSLTTVNMPSSMTGLQFLQQTFFGCSSLTTCPTFPASLNSVISIGAMFQNCTKLLSATNLPTSMSACTTLGSLFNGCVSLQQVVMPATMSAAASSWLNAFLQCFSLRTVTLPTTQLTGLTGFQSTFNNCPSLTTINNFNRIGDTATTANNYIDATSAFGVVAGATGGTLVGKFSKFDWTGTVGIITGLSTLRLSNVATGQWGGTSPQINISYSNMSQAALVTLFGDLQTVTGKTINITASTGAAALTAPERAIATGKGWSIIG
jgi:hypothetical protein